MDFRVEGQLRMAVARRKPKFVIVQGRFFLFFPPLAASHTSYLAQSFPWRCCFKSEVSGQMRNSLRGALLVLVTDHILLILVTPLGLPYVLTHLSS